mmetsp:Transcript_27928/g.83698  ORF Transcript_27928/g.83698 Transcript_27928/m.83698 type:complete len:211 (-) Transcript_27928:38-670(-)
MLIRRVTRLLLLVALPQIAALSPLAGLASLPRSHPLAFGCGLTCAKTVAADLLVQASVEKTPLKHVDRRRALVFAFYGLAYMGGVQYFLFNRVYPRLFPRASAWAALSTADKWRDLPGARSVLAQVLVDQGLHWPLSALPCYYLCAAAARGGGLRRLARNWRADVLACWCVWVPAEAAIFGLLPLHWQVPSTALVSFGYVALLSSMRGRG